MSEEDVALRGGQHALTACRKGEDRRSGAGRRRISAIVPVFNEEKTVSGVVQALLQSNLIDEVICVNDGSTDGSLAILQALADRIELIDLQNNRGKGHALTVGIKRSSGEIVAFFDADLTNLSGDYIRMLLTPILQGDARAVLGYPVVAPLTGERAYYRADLLPHLDRMAETGFGAEMFLNSLFDREEVATIRLRGLKALLKHEKHGAVKAVQEYLGAGIEIAQEIARREGLLAVDKQIIAGLKSVTSLQMLKKTVERVQSPLLKRILKEYVIQYIEMIEGYWRESD